MSDDHQVCIDQNMARTFPLGHEQGVRLQLALQPTVLEPCLRLDAEIVPSPAADSEDSRLNLAGMLAESCC